jgi:hypothetical protein
MVQVNLQMARKYKDAVFACQDILDAVKIVSVGMAGNKYL